MASRRACVLARIANADEGVDRQALREAYLDDNPRGVTPLMTAVSTGAEAAIERELASPKVNVDAIAEGAVSALVLAIPRGESVVERLLAAGADPDTRTVGDRTPLHLAAAAGSLGLVERLLAAGARSVRDALGEPPIVTAIAHGAMPVVAKLLAIAVDDRDCERAFRAACAHDRVDAMRMLCERFGEGIAKEAGALLVAAEHGALGAVTFLLDAGASIDKFDLKDEQSALMHAATRGHHAVAELLLARGANPNAQTEWFVTALRIARKRGDARMVALLQTHGAHEGEGEETIDVVLPYAHYTSAIAPATSGPSSMEQAIATDDVIALETLLDPLPSPYVLAQMLAGAASAHAHHAVAYLLACGADTAKGLGPAIRAGATRAVRLVLAARPNPLTGEATMDAVAQPDPWLLADLLERGAPVDAQQYSQSAIARAVMHGRSHHVEQLLARGAKLDVAALLASAAAGGHVRCIQVLVAHERVGLDAALLAAAAHPRAVETLVRLGANPEARDENGDSLLHRGAETPWVDLHLKLAGRFLDERGGRGWTPLHRAARGGTPATIASLLAAGANVDARNDDGATPLHFACTYPRPGIVEALLAGGASHRVSANDGSTPLHAAVAHPETVRVLLAAGADREARDQQQRTPRERAEAELAALTHWTYAQRPARERALALLVAP